MACTGGWLPQAAAGPVSAQASPPMTEARVRAFASQAQKESRGDPTALVLALDRHVRETWGEFESFPTSILRREDLLVTLSTPYMAYRRAIVDVLRTRRPIEQAAWVDTAVVSVNPARLGGPDVEAVVLDREGREVAPVRNLLRPMTFANGNGDEGVLHAGDVHFPASAFAPGAPVTLTIRAGKDGPFVYTFSDAELAILK